MLANVLAGPTVAQTGCTSAQLLEVQKSLFKDGYFKHLKTHFLDMNISCQAIWHLDSFVPMLSISWLRITQVEEILVFFLSDLG